MGKTTDSKIMDKASIRIVDDGFVIPQTRLDIQADGRRVTYNGGVYTSDKKPIEESIHVAVPINQLDDISELNLEYTYLKGKYIFGGLLRTHFGHFCLESTARLWATETIGAFDGILFLNLANKNRDGSIKHNDSIPDFARELTRVLGINTLMKVITEPTRVERLFVPDQICDGTTENGIAGNFIHRKFLSKLRKKPVVTGKKIYVSRSQFAANNVLKASLFDELSIEKNLSNEGYEIIYPEQYSIQKQIDIYSEAEYLIFAEGSAIHLMAFVASPDQKVIIIARRVKDHKKFESLVSAYGAFVKQIEVIKHQIATNHKALAAQVNSATPILDMQKLRDLLIEYKFIHGNDWKYPSKEDEERFISGIQEKLDVLNKNLNVFCMLSDRYKVLANEDELTWQNSFYSNNYLLFSTHLG